MNLKTCIHGVVGKTKCKTCLKLETAARRLANLERYRGYARKWHRKVFGVLTGERRIGVCPLCDTKDIELRPDHNHETMKLRDWICARCNMALGFMEQNPNLLRLLAYLEKHK